MRSKWGRVAGTGMNAERYDDNYNPTSHLGRRKNVRKSSSGYSYQIDAQGVDGVMLPNNLDDKDYNNYVAERSGPVKVIKKGNKGGTTK